MGLGNQGMKDFICSFLKHPFHTLCLTLLTLVLPLSFLQLARLASPTPHSTASSSSLISILLQANPPLLHFLVSFTCLAALLHVLTGGLLRLPTSIAWAWLCLFQACISLGFEATIAAQTEPARATSDSHVMWFGRLIFLVGLFETMLVWERIVVKQVVDDAIFGVAVKEGCMSRMVVGTAFSMLWLWMLRDEVEPLVLVAGEGLVKGMGWGKFVRQLVSFATSITGILRTVEVVVWVGKLLLLPGGEADEDFGCYASPVDDEI